MREMILQLDWDSTLFWRDNGTRVEESVLPISQELRRELDAYYLGYSELYNQSGDDRPVDVMDKRLLDDTGLGVWGKLRAELSGIYRVVFYSEEFQESFESPEEFLKFRRRLNA